MVVTGDGTILLDSFVVLVSAYSYTHMVKLSKGTQTCIHAYLLNPKGLCKCDTNIYIVHSNRDMCKMPAESNDN